jgi:hypothetical protein
VSFRSLGNLGGGPQAHPCSFHGESWISFTLTSERFLRLARYEHQIRGPNGRQQCSLPFSVERPNHQAGRYVPAIDDS